MYPVGPIGGGVYPVGPIGGGVYPIDGGFAGCGCIGLCPKGKEVLDECCGGITIGFMASGLLV